MAEHRDNNNLLEFPTHASLSDPTANYPDYSCRLDLQQFSGLLPTNTMAASPAGGRKRWMTSAHHSRERLKAWCNWCRIPERLDRVNEGKPRNYEQGRTSHDHI